MSTPHPLTPAVAASNANACRATSDMMNDTSCDITQRQPRCRPRAARRQTTLTELWSCVHPLAKGNVTTHHEGHRHTAKTRRTTQGHTRSQPHKTKDERTPIRPSLDNQLLTSTNNGYDAVSHIDNEDARTDKASTIARSLAIYVRAQMSTPQPLTPTLPATYANACYATSAIMTDATSPVSQGQTTWDNGYAAESQIDDKGLPRDAWVYAWEDSQDALSDTTDSCAGYMSMKPN